MSDYDDDIDLDEGASDAMDDWEDEEELEEQKKEAQRLKDAAEKAKKDEAAQKKAERQMRIEAAKGNVEDDTDDIDRIGEKEYKDRLARHDVELTYGIDSNQIEAKPLAVMKPETAKDYAVMGTKIGDCMKTFRTNKFFFYAVNRLVTKTCDKLSLDDANDLQKKLNVITAERTRVLKEAGKKKLKEEGDKEEQPEVTRGNQAMMDYEGRNDLKGDAGELEDFM